MTAWNPECGVGGTRGPTRSQERPCRAPFELQGLGAEGRPRQVGVPWGWGLQVSTHEGEPRRHKGRASTGPTLASWTCWGLTIHGFRAGVRLLRAQQDGPGAPAREPGGCQHLG